MPTDLEIALLINWFPGLKKLIFSAAQANFFAREECAQALSGAEIKKIYASDEFKRALEYLKREQVRVCWPGQADFPAEFLPYPELANVLFYRGAPAWLNYACVGVVGSRAPSYEALQWLDWHLPRYLQDRRPCIISGGARGVDFRAHELAIKMNCPTVAFMPVGLYHRYPEEFSEIENEIIVGGGAVVSPFYLSQKLLRRNFVFRNRYLAALSRFLLVVEARSRSGTMMTARHAMELDGQVLVLPASPLTRYAQGNLQLLAANATLAVTHRDLQTAHDRKCLDRPLHGPRSQASKEHINSPDGGCS